MESELKLEVNLSREYLSSESRVFKTERFFFDAKKLSGIDKLILKIAELIQKNFNYFENKFNRKFCVQTFNHEFKFEFVFGISGKSVSLKLNERDIIFTKIQLKNKEVKTNDQRVNLFLKNNQIFNVFVSEEEIEFDVNDLKKLYYVSNVDYVNFPMLSIDQQKLVEIENENVLVQGVAGSGKTNICINKIIWTASKHYSGKILYTTFSRGLLIDTKNKIELFKNNIKQFIENYHNGKIVFLDRNHKEAIEKKLGVFVVSDNEKNLIKNLESQVEFLENKVDYFLLEDIYRIISNDSFEIASEEVFEKQFLNDFSNHQLKNKLEKLKDISSSVCFKEIYGLIFGSWRNGEKLHKNEYFDLRKDSFNEREISAIYELAVEYQKYKFSHNLIDNNDISYKILKNIQKFDKYSLCIADEVQDFTEVNLHLLNEISIKMFAVGDALQMINPTYFSFAGLKRIMFRENVVSVAELEYNYRNNEKIVEILDALSEINIKAFGTHSFVLKNESVDNGTATQAIYTEGSGFIQKVLANKYENFTILVSGPEEKKKLREKLKKQEILTVAEIKGLERDTVVAYNILSSNQKKWENLQKFNINHKKADENSVYRYYFNLFYVAISRAKHNLFVCEDFKINLFNDFFKNNFEILSANDCFEKFAKLATKLEIDEDEIWERVNEFIKLGQFENAEFIAGKFGDNAEQLKAISKIKAYKDFVFKGKNHEAGIALWKAGLLDEAKIQFELAGDKKLIEFLDNLNSQNSSNLDGEIAKFFTDFDDNPDAQKLIIEVLKSEIENMQKIHNEMKLKLKDFKEKKNGNKRIK
ncbi:MAG: AAA family ATPase [Clostridia bacterium]|nr:AAA family ATPase [Clostridia bacterium]